MKRVFLALLVFFVSIPAFAADLPFTDVSPSDDYYGDLVSLYERGVIPDSPNKRFNPTSLINRDDFVSIVVWVGCKKCLSPTFDDIIKYNSLPFVDFARANPNFYCVSYAKEQGIVEGYVIGPDGSSKCENGESYTATPFCANNKITRIEAAAVLLRQAGLWDNARNTANFARTLTIADATDSWYGYAQKAVQSGMITLPSDGKIRPNENISKREFVQMAAKIFRINMCSLRSADGQNSNSPSSTTNSSQPSSNTQTPTSPNTGSNPPNNQSPSSLTSEVRILDAWASCSTSTPVSNFTSASAASYTFFGRTETIGGPYIYSWEFARAQDGTRLSGTGACLSNFALSGNGTWLVRLTVRDPATWVTSTSLASVEVRDGTPVPTGSLQGLSVQIRANVLSTTAPSTVNLSSQINGGTGPYTYRWDFADGSFSTDPNPSHLYETGGVRPVTLTVRDSKWATSIASVVLVFDENADLDGDGVLNRDDLCPAVFGLKDNKGCPNVTVYIPPTNTATRSVISSLGSLNSTLTLPGVGGSCRLGYAKDVWALYGRATCSSCPCAIDLAFTADARSCDVIFPAIVSLDKKTIYSRGKVFELRF